MDIRLAKINLMPIRVFHDAAGHRDVCVMFFKRPLQNFIHGRFQPIVRVDESDKYAPAGFNAIVSSVCLPSVLLMNDTDPAISCRPSITHIRASVRRAIIDQNDFQISIRLVDELTVYNGQDNVQPCTQEQSLKSGEIFSSGFLRHGRWISIHAVYFLLVNIRVIRGLSS